MQYSLLVLQVCSGAVPVQKMALAIHVGVKISTISLH